MRKRVRIIQSKRFYLFAVNAMSSDEITCKLERKRKHIPEQQGQFFIYNQRYVIIITCVCVCVKIVMIIICTSPFSSRLCVASVKFKEFFSDRNESEIVLVK